MHNKKTIILYSLAVAMAIVIAMVLRHSILPEALSNWLDDTIFFRFYSTQKKIFKAAYYKLLPVFGADKAIILATMLAAQSGNESDGWKSHVFVTCNNAFGMKIKSDGTLRPYQSGVGIAANDGGYYGYYKTVEDSARDAALWLYETQAKYQAFAPVTDLTSYVNALAQLGYFEGEPASQYEADVKPYLNTNLAA